jgi:hypothetical protein
MWMRSLGGHTRAERRLHARVLDANQLRFVTCDRLLQLVPALARTRS